MAKKKPMPLYKQKSSAKAVSEKSVGEPHSHTYIMHLWI